jgi:hypothetical protein
MLRPARDSCIYLISFILGLGAGGCLAPPSPSPSPSRQPHPHLRCHRTNIVQSAPRSSFSTGLWAERLDRAKAPPNRDFPIGLCSRLGDTSFCGKWLQAGLVHIADPTQRHSLLGRKER